MAYRPGLGAGYVTNMSHDITVKYDIITMHVSYNYIDLLCCHHADEASDLEACQVLTTNAENLSSAISKALYHTQSASIRVTMEKRAELGLTHVVETAGKPSQHHRVRECRLAIHDT